MPQVFRDLFEATGGWPADLAFTPLEPLARYRFADGTRFDASSDLDVHCAPARRGARRRAPATTGGPSPPGPSGSGRPAAARSSSPRSAARRRSPGSRCASRATSRAIAPGTSLRALGRRYLRDPRLRTYLDRYATYTGSDPRRAPAALAAVPVRRAGVRRLVRAGRADAGSGDAVHDRAVERGACGCGSARGSPGSVLSGGRVGGVRARGRRPPARGRRRRQRRRLRRLRHAASRRPAPPAGWPGRPRRCPASSCCSALRGRTPGLAHHNVLFPADYDAEFDAVFGPARPAGRGPDPLRQRAGRPGRAAGRARGVVRAGQRPAARHAGPGAVDWRAPGLSGTYADHLLDLLADRGLPVRERLLFSEVLSPGGPRAADRRGRAAPSTARRATARARPSCARPTARPCPACSSSAAPPTPAAGCRWSRCRRRSWPAWSARQDGGVTRLERLAVLVALLVVLVACSSVAQPVAAGLGALAASPPASSSPTASRGCAGGSTPGSAPTSPSR